MTPHLVYDAATDGLWYWWLYPVLAIFPMVGCVVAVRAYSKAKAAHLLEGPNGTSRVLLGLVVLALWSSLPVYGGCQSYSEYRRFRNRLNSRDFTIVEGTVEDFVPQRADGHPPESFRVGSHSYEYSDYELAPGYHRVRVRGGVIAGGMRVRLADIEGHIARIEILNY